MKLTQDELVKITQMIKGSSRVTLENFQLLNQKTEKGLIVFAGDSMIEYMNLSVLFEGFKIVNRGVAGATTQFMIENLDRIFGDINPSQIWLSIGSNDLTLLDSYPEKIAKDVENLFGNIRNKFPNVKLFYLATTPILNEDHKLYKKLYIGGKTNEQQLKINELMSKVTKDKNITMVNNFEILLDQSTGFLNEKYTPDGIHLNQLGYKEYAKQIIETLKANQ